MKIASDQKVRTLIEEMVIELVVSILLNKSTQDD